jgi:sarcosine oxidase subunit beta
MRELPHTADVVIVGGGIIGLSVAYHLGQYGIRPLVLERGRLGEGSTGRSSGGIRRLFDTEPAVRLAVESVQFWEHFEYFTGQSLDWHRNGYLLVARSEPSRDLLLRGWPIQQRWGVPSSKLTAAQVTKLLPAMQSEDILMALHCSSDGYAGPYEALQGFRAGALKHGAILIEHCETVGIHLQGGQVTAVETPRGRVQTPLIVNAAGAWAPLVGRLIGVQVPILPQRQHQWIIQAPSVHFTMPCTLDLDSTLYVRPEGPNFLLGIASHEPSGSYDFSVRPDAFLPVAEEAMRRFPQFESAQLVRTWAGLYEMTPDHEPILGPCGPEGSFIAAGFSGHGFMKAPAAGRIIAEFITLGKATTMPIEPFLLSRFGGIQAA